MFEMTCTYNDANAMMSGMVFVIIFDRVYPVVFTLNSCWFTLP